VGREIKKCKYKIEGIKWDNKPKKALGIYFGHDIDKCDELNWVGTDFVCLYNYEF
jgi:hypothetical protein